MKSLLFGLAIFLLAASGVFAAENKVDPAATEKQVT